MATSLPKIKNHERLERLSALSPDQLDDSLRWLAGHAPETFDAVLDAIEPIALSRPEDPRAVCATCGADIGIFVKFGLDWCHYEDDALGNSEIYDPGHPPQLVWREPGQRLAAS